MSKTEERDLLQLLREDDDRGMQIIFKRFYKYLVVTAYQIQDDDDRAKDIVQDVLFDFWKKRDSLVINTSLKAYLRRAVLNKSIDEIRSRKKLVFDDQLMTQQLEATGAKMEEQEESLALSDLKSQITHAIDSLPERCKLVFKLSRFEEMSHKEISTALNISTKTIENQITKALKHVRLQLAQYGKILLLLASNFFD